MTGISVILSTPPMAPFDVPFDPVLAAVALLALALTAGTLWRGDIITLPD